jgi:hypothetical protein
LKYSKTEASVSVSSVKKKIFCWLNTKQFCFYRYFPIDVHKPHLRCTLYQLNDYLSFQHRE